MEPNFKQSVVEQNRSLTEFFESDIVDMKFKPKKKKNKKGDDSESESEVAIDIIENVDEDGLIDIKRPIVWCSETDLFLNYLMTERDFNHNELDFKIGIDFGQESLKVRFYYQLNAQ